MARSKKTSNIYYDGFEGIDTRKCHNGKESSSYVENFRIKNDGSLKKRGGYRHIGACPTGSIVDIWYDEEICTDNKCLYFTDSKSVIATDLKTGESNSVTIFSDAEPEGKFFYDQGSLYLKNSKKIYRISNSSINSVTGYVPLLGKDWGTSYPGEIYQPRNLLHNRVRISYKIPETHTAMLPTLYPVASVTSLYRNGTLVAKTEYSIDTRFNTININSVEAGDEFLAVVNLSATSPNKELFLASQNFTVHENINGSQIYAWNTKSKNLIFSSTYVSEDDFNDSEAVCPNHGRLYFTDDNIICVGNENSVVTAIIKYYDKLLVFSKKEAWLIDPKPVDGNKPYSIKINSHEGCYNSDAYTIVNGILYTVGSRGLLRWDIDPEYPSRSNVKLVSEEITEHLTKDFLSNAFLFYSSSTNEIWLYSNTPGKKIYVYDLSNKNWVAFSNLSPHQFFEFDGKAYFHDRNDIFCFSEDCDSDIESSGAKTAIIGRFESGVLSFDSTDKKRLYLGKIIGDLKDGVFSMDITCDTNESIHLETTSAKEDTITVRRLNSGKFRNLKFSFTCRGQSGMTIHSVKLTARSKE